MGRRAGIVNRKAAGRVENGCLIEMAALVTLGSPNCYFVVAVPLAFVLHHAPKSVGRRGTGMAHRHTIRPACLRWVGPVRYRGNISGM